MGAFFSAFSPISNTASVSCSAGDFDCAGFVWLPWCYSLTRDSVVLTIVYVVLLPYFFMRLTEFLVHARSLSIFLSLSVSHTLSLSHTRKHTEGQSNYPDARTQQGSNRLLPNIACSLEKSHNAVKVRNKLSSPHLSLLTITFQWNKIPWSV